MQSFSISNAGIIKNKNVENYHSSMLCIIKKNTKIFHLKHGELSLKRCRDLPFHNVGVYHSNMHSFINPKMQRLGLQNSEVIIHKRRFLSIQNIDIYPSLSN
jgi:hypothetical protein